MASAVWWRPCSVLSEHHLRAEQRRDPDDRLISRYVGRYIGVILILLEHFPGAGPNCCGRSAPVLGRHDGDVGCVVAAGIRITQTRWAVAMC